MAHEITILNGRAETAWVAAPPWHGLGQQLPADASLDVWATAAGMNWTAQPCSLFYAPGTDHTQVNPVTNYKALVRSDTGTVLSVVSNKYREIQPRQVLEFYRSLIEANTGWRMETAGTLRGGKRVWALATNADNFKVTQDDQINRYLLLATSYDGMMATVVQPTTVRVVCANTLAQAVGSDGRKALMQIPHQAIFRPDLIKGELGIESNAAWEQFKANADRLAARKVSRDEVAAFFIEVLYGDEDKVPAGNQRNLTLLGSLYEGGMGQHTVSAKGTAWGLVNTITRFVDHERTSSSADSRLNAAWFGAGNRLKSRAVEAALKLAA